MDVLSMALGLLIGLVIVALMVMKLFSLQKEKGEILSQKNLFQADVERLSKEKNESQEEIKEYREKVESLNSSLLITQSENKNLSENLKTQKEELLSLQEKFKFEFEQLAQKILEEKSKKFTETNEDKISAILNPLKEKISKFEEKVENVNKEHISRNSSLIEQIKALTDLQNVMTAETKNLTNALRHDTKVQGDWGELVLESILEKSGLRKGYEYFPQNSYTQSDGSILRPDILVRLPEDKTLIIDSKVSLTAYERLVNADDEDDKRKFLQQHILSVRSHIKELADKKYQLIEQLKSPDFVLLFIPIEPAFIMAIHEDQKLYMDAFSKNIIIVSNSTLLATLRTIDSIWKQEYQNKNSLEIARQAGLLYDKFIAFTEDLKNIGNRIEQTQKTYDDAMNKLQTGRGNLIGRTQKLKKLGVQSSKRLDESFNVEDEEE
ncbi:MAG: DNA recombination protein RmuC [Chitinophagales bacterium]|nr:DNA recombination protein RmuC [Chitinophagales bacterium]